MKLARVSNKVYTSVLAIKIDFPESIFEYCTSKGG